MTTFRGRAGYGTLFKGTAVASVAVATAVGLAGPAAAEPLDGTYTVVYTGMMGATLDSTWGFTSCGPSCARQDVNDGPPREFHLQGNTWSTSFTNNGVTCSTTIDKDTLAGIFKCGDLAQSTYQIQLTRSS